MESHIISRHGNDFLVYMRLMKKKVITVVLNGLDHSNRGGYGPVSMSDLSAGSLAVARAAFAQLQK